MKGFSLFVLVFAAALSILKAQNSRYVSVFYHAETKAFRIEHEYVPGADGWASFSNDINETGWSSLEVHTIDSIPDDAQSQAAGIMEGSLTAELIAMHWNNTLATYCSDDQKMCDKIKGFLIENYAFINRSIEDNPQDPYWYQVRQVYQQLEGLKMGYDLMPIAKSLPLSSFDFLLMQIGGLGDLEQALNRTSKHGVHADQKHRVVGQGSCSALIKLLPSNKDIFISHVTWIAFTSMLRVYKFYDFQLVKNSEPELHIFSQNQSFSSYPGVLYSGDDFYMLDSGLVVQETTIENNNPDLWKYVTSNTVLEWVRTIVANRKAKDGRQWVSLFSKYNSGTYNNQWMVLDYNKFTPGKPLIPGTLWILEQLPGMVEMADMTEHLNENGYWASYNLPYFTTIYNTSDVPDLVKKFGSWFDYDLNPRAQMFKRDQGKVVDLASMLKLMRYNDYKNDPLSKCKCNPPFSAENAISARCDLNPANGTYPFEALGHRKHGGTDAKITNYMMFQDFTALAVSGPTFDQQPVFQWSTSGWPRPYGHPDKWDFKPVFVKWDSNMKYSNLEQDNVAVY